VGPGGLRAEVTAARPGDVLCLLDGVYTEAIQPAADGTAGAPITVRALNDGAVTIDGQGVRIPLMLYRDWWIVDGLVLRNGAIAAARIEGDNNVLRRVSAYNADTNDNSSVIFIWGDSNLLEDVVAAGTGRYTVEVYQGNGNTLRRVFAKWEGWDGRGFCGVSWPNGYTIGVYNASNTTVENVIAYGRAPSAGIMVQANHDVAVADNNQVLGSMALLQGRDTDGSVWTFGAGQEQPGSRPATTTNPPCDTNITQWEWGGQRVGFLLYGQGSLRNNVFRDVLAADNMGIGFFAAKPYAAGAVSGNVLERAALHGNGAGAASWERSSGGQLLNGLSVQVTAGAPVLNRRYVNRTLTSAALLPWLMEDRARAELGVSIDAIWNQYAN
jgi:hypothetical protein